MLFRSVAEFIAGGQRLSDAKGERSKVYLPRRWRLVPGGDGSARSGKVLARIYRGSEYEYLAAVDGFNEAVRLFAAPKLEAGDSLSLRYE